MCVCTCMCLCVCIRTWKNLCDLDKIYVIWYTDIHAYMSMYIAFVVHFYKLLLHSDYYLTL